jgi:hypothetical protein
MTFFTEVEKHNAKIHIDHKILQIANITLSKKSKAGGTMLSNFKIYYKGIVIRTIRTSIKQGHKPLEQTLIHIVS